MSNINVGVLLKLSDQFSPNINKALSATKNLANGLIRLCIVGDGAVNKVDGVLNCVSGKFAMFGVSIGATATINNMIKFEDRINKIGTIAKANAKDTETYKKQMDGLSDAIYKAATQPDIKVDASEIVDAIDIIMEKTRDLKFARDNLENIGRAMRAFGVSGSDIGFMMSEFSKLGYGAEEVTKLMDEMYVQGNKGAFTAKSFAQYGSQIIASYSAIGTSSKDIKNANAAMQILRMTFETDAEAVTGLKSIMADLGDETKKEYLKKYGISVRDANGDMRDLNDIMLDIVAAESKLEGDAKDTFLSKFGENAKTGIRAFIKDGHKLKDFLELGDVTGKFSEAAESNSQSLAVNLENLQTAFDGFANKNIEPILNKVAKALNWISQDPKRFDILFKTLAGGFALVFGMKTIALIAQTVSGLRNISSSLGNIGQAGSNMNVTGVTPVYVTNMGAMQNMSNVPSRVSTPSRTNPNFTPIPKKNTFLMTSMWFGIPAALVKIPMAVSEWQAANRDTSLSDKEKARRKGGAAGDAIGSIGGAILGGMAATASSAAIGAAVGSVVPGLGTVVGALAGIAMSIGGVFIGGKIGRDIFGSIFENLAGNNIADELQNTPKVEMLKSEATLEGNAEIGIKVEVTDDRVNVKTKENKNDINNTKFIIGSKDDFFMAGTF